MFDVNKRLDALEADVQRVLDHMYCNDIAELDVAEEFLKKEIFIVSVDGPYAATCNYKVSCMFYKYQYICARSSCLERDLAVLVRATELRDLFDAWYINLNNKEG